MKSSWIFLVVISAVFGHNFNCPKYDCKDNIVGEGATCAFEQRQKLDLHQCNTTAGLACQKIEFEAPSVCVKVPAPSHSLLPGQECKDGSECLSKNCPDPAKEGEPRVCKGKKADEDCKTNAECDRGLFCKDGKICRKVDEGCDMKGEGCPPNKVCNRAEGKCVLIGSIDNGKPAPFPAACKTYHQNLKGDCVATPTSKNLKMLNCPETNQCEYQLGSDPVKSSCVCGRNTDGSKFCPPGKGDIDLSEYMKKLPTDQCHVDLGPFCRNKEMAKMPLDYVKAYIAYTELNNPTLWVDSECFKKALFPDYFEARKRVPYVEVIDGTRFTVYLFVIVGGMCILILVIIMVAIYVKKKQVKRREEEEGDEDR